MYCRSLPALLALTALTPLPAQPPAKSTQQPEAARPQEPVKGTPAPAKAGETQQPANDKPAPPRELTPQEQKAKLEAEIERLQKEIAFVRARRGTIKTTIAEKLAQQSQTFEPKKINAGTSRAAAPAALSAPPRKAKVLEAAEGADLGADVLLLVNGRPIKQSEVNQLIDYLKGFPATDGADVVAAEAMAERAVRELIQIEVAHAAFLKEADAAAARMKQLQAQLEKGTDIGELIKTAPVNDPDREPGAAFTITRNSPHGLVLERMAFATKPGHATQIFRTPLGFTILRVEKFEKGTTPLQDRADVRMLMIPYGPDLMEVRKALMPLHTGQLDIVIKDEKTRQLLPIQFR